MYILGFEVHLQTMQFILRCILYGPVALTPTGFPIIKCIIDTTRVIMLGFQIILYHRYDSCNYVRFPNYIVS